MDDLKKKAPLIRKGLVVLGLRERRATTIDKLASLEAQLAASELGQAIKATRDQLADLQHAVNQAEIEMRDGLAAWYKAHNNDRAPIPGGEVKVYRQYHYDPPALRQWLATNAPVYLTITPTEAVRGWAIQNAPEALAIDEKAVNKAADMLAGQGAPFEVVLDPRGQITKDLPELHQLAGALDDDEAGHE